MVYGLQEVEDSYQSLVENMDEQDLEVIKDSLCVKYTKWHVAPGGGKQDGDEDAVRCGTNF